MRESHAFRVRFSHGPVVFDSRNVKRATKSDTSSHCLITSSALYHSLEDYALQPPIVPSPRRPANQQAGKAAIGHQEAGKHGGQETLKNMTGSLFESKYHLSPHNTGLEPSSSW